MRTPRQIQPGAETEIFNLSAAVVQPNFSAYPILARVAVFRAPNPYFLTAITLTTSIVSQGGGALIGVWVVVGKDGPTLQYDLNIRSPICHVSFSEVATLTAPRYHECTFVPLVRPIYLPSDNPVALYVGGNNVDADNALTTFCALHMVRDLEQQG